MQDQTPAFWQLLRELRQKFLSDEPISADYWQSTEQLAAYDEAFARRISWKWNAVLTELVHLGWCAPPTRALIDWGCGTGVATEAVLPFLKPAPSEIYLHDRSVRAAVFAQQKIRDLSPESTVALWVPADLPKPFGLVASHVLNELGDSETAALFAVARAAEFVLIVEPGTKSSAFKMSSFRDKLLAAGLHIVAPCTHSASCPALREPKHWCHSFARPPSAISHDPFWSRFAKELSIDLRSLPFSYVLLTKGEPNANTARSRVIGRPRLHKSHAQALLCNKDGLSLKHLIQRKQPEAFAEATKGERWLDA